MLHNQSGKSKATPCKNTDASSKLNPVNTEILFKSFEYSKKKGRSFRTFPLAGQEQRWINRLSCE
jgi:hypothetical protein